MTIHIERTALLLDQLTQALKSLNLWQTQQPEINALLSSAPFCCDTLSFEQWLQFVFIPKISQMISLGESLPDKISLMPMAEESFKYLSTQADPLLMIIKRIDKTLTGQGE